MKETFYEKDSLTILTLHNRTFSYSDHETNNILYFLKKTPRTILIEFKTCFDAGNLYHQWFNYRYSAAHNISLYTFEGRPYRQTTCFWEKQKLLLKHESLKNAYSKKRSFNFIETPTHETVHLLFQITVSIIYRVCIEI